MVAVKSRWEGFGFPAKAGLIAGALAIVVLMGVGGYWILRDDYQVLFSDLNGQDASAMVAELDRLKVPYRLAENGTTILVEQANVYKTRLKLMGKGLDLHGSVGFEIFNNADYGMTEFSQKVNYQRAMQGEIARTIMGFEEVKNARVHLVLPDSGLFKRQNAKPKASISLVMKGDAQLSPEQVSGIQRLVAASVPEIDPASVTVVDHRGVAISKAVASDPLESMVPGRLEAKRQIEDYLTRKILNVLDRAVGPGKAIVSVDATVNYDQVKVTRDDIVPLPNTNGQNVGAIARRRESQQGTDPYPELASLGLSNAAQRTQTQGGQASTTADTEYLNGRRVEQVVSSPGTLRRLSVGVMVPGISDPAELAKLREVVSMAVGVSQARGDAIVVYHMDAAANQSPAPGAATGVGAPDDDRGGPAATRATDPPQTRSNPVTAQNALAALLVVLATLFAAYLLMRSARRGSAQTRLSPEERDRMLREVSAWASAPRG